jgi:hypothetical protein
VLAEDKAVHAAREATCRLLADGRITPQASALTIAP